MTRREDRQTLLHIIKEARAGGARLAPACALAGIDPRTLQRWQLGDGLLRRVHGNHADGRDAIREFRPGLGSVLIKGAAPGYPAAAARLVYSSRNDEQTRTDSRRRDGGDAALSGTANAKPKSKSRN